MYESQIVILIHQNIDQSCLIATVEATIATIVLKLALIATEVGGDKRIAHHTILMDRPARDVTTRDVTKSLVRIAVEEEELENEALAFRSTCSFGSNTIKTLLV